MAFFAKYGLLWWLGFDDCKILKTDLPEEKAKTKEEKPKNKITFDTKFKTDDDIIKEFLESLK